MGTKGRASKKKPLTKKASVVPRIPMSPLFNPLSGVPTYLHFHAWLLRRQIYYPMATNYARDVNAIAAKYNANPSDILPPAREAYAAALPERYMRTNTLTALRLWDEFVRSINLTKGVPLDWCTTTGAVGDLLGLSGRKVVKYLKYFATQEDAPLEVFYGTAHPAHAGMYKVPLKFYPFCAQQLKEDEERWLPPPKTG